MSFEVQYIPIDCARVAVRTRHRCNDVGNTDSPAHKDMDLRTIGKGHITP